MEMLHKYQIDYHVDRNCKTIPFCLLLDCGDQIIYFELRKVSNFNPWIYFCDDINLGIDETGKIFVVRTGVTKEYHSMVSVHTGKDGFDGITASIEQNDVAILRTAFNYVRDYVWWDFGRENMHTAHLTYILGEDGDGYYIVDSPTSFCNVNEIRQDYNPSVVKIPKWHFAEAFEKCCEIYAIKFNRLLDKEEEFHLFEKNLKKMISNYTDVPEGIYVGRSALIHMMERCDLEEERFFDSFFTYHLMASRRLLLKKCLCLFGKNMGVCPNTMSCLDKSIENWKKINDLSAGYYYRKEKVGATVKSILYSLIENEDNLIEYLKKYVR